MTSVPVRRISFDEQLASLPRHFAGDGDLISSHLTACLSSVFPDGEDFFVKSVRHFRDQIDDPILKEQVKGFIGQEALHGREHRAFNARLAELGYGTEVIERWTNRGLELRWKLAPKIANLAVTAALEHVTATLAELIMSDEQLRADLGHEAVRDLFLWHALEESEHKAVAFDVYRAVGGGERLRIWTMKLIRIGFTVGMGLTVAVSLAGDPASRDLRGLRRSWKRFRRSPMVSKATWRRLKDYERVGFHPDDHDSSALLDHWRGELFGAEGRLNPLLAGYAPAA